VQEKTFFLFGGIQSNCLISHASRLGASATPRHSKTTAEKSTVIFYKEKTYA